MFHITTVYTNTFHKLFPVILTYSKLEKDVPKFGESLMGDVKKFCICIICESLNNMLPDVRIVKIHQRNVWKLRCPLHGTVCANGPGNFH